MVELRPADDTQQLSPRSDATAARQQAIDVWPHEAHRAAIARQARVPCGRAALQQQQGDTPRLTLQAQFSRADAG
jgi:hypothetical protein